MNEFEDEDKRIVYYLQKNWIKELCAFLNDEFEQEMCEIYHADMKEWKKKKVFERWKDGEFIYMIATSALSVGIDYKQVRLMVHQEHARSMIDLY